MNRKRWIIVGIVAAFVAAFAAIGLVSRSTGSNTAATTATVVSSTSGTAPSAMWYWTMTVSPSDPNLLVLATSDGLYRSTDGGKTWQSTGPKGFNATSVVQNGDKLLAAGVHTGAVASPVVSTGKARSPATGPGLVVTSSDGGKTWTQVHPNGLPSSGLQALATDPDGKTLYAVLTNGRFYTLDRRRRDVQARLGEARHPAVGDRDHAGQPLRRRRHGHGRRTRAPTARTGSARRSRTRAAARW